MARVTKINVGGTNYDIAHEGELKNSGFEVVTALPTTELFEGRQVLYQNRVWVYSNGWVSPNNPVSFSTGGTLSSSTEALTAAARYIELNNFQLEQIPELLNKALFISNNDNCVKKSDRLYELIDNETGTITVLSGIVNPVIGQTLRYTAINPSYGLKELYDRTYSNGNTPYSVYCVYIPQNLRASKAIYKIEYYVYTNATGDGDVNDRDNYVWKTVFDKELNQMTSILYPIQNTVYDTNTHIYTYIYNIRVSITPTTKDDSSNISIKDIDIKYFGLNHQPLIYANRLINYDAVIEPTQTRETFKSAPWILQYLTQGVNWLKANNVRLSDYNTKVAALEQADNTKLDKRAYNHIYTNCGHLNGSRTSQGALIIELPFAPNSDSNNSMTYIELNVYSHKKGCSKYIIGVYSYSQNSSYEWSAYSYMGYNCFSKISFGRRTDNNNIVVVLGDFTDLHKNEHFSISNIITGFNRNNDDTDGFLLYTDTDSNNYSILKQSTDIPLNISYNDLTDKPTLFSGSYNDLTDKPTLFSGSYDDLTDKPTLATVATSGSYDDLLNKPALVFQNIGGTISSAQIPDGLIANGKLANSSMSLNGTTVNLGDTANVPWYVDYNETDYPARIRDHWLQIYRNEEWANLVYLGDIHPTQVVQITSLANLAWYNEQVSEYEVDSSTTLSILNGTTKPATLLLNCSAEQLTLNLFPISGKQYGKGSLDSLISDLQGKGFSVFVENDLDAIQQSGSDYLVRVKICKVPRPKAIIECYVAR